MLHSPSLIHVYAEAKYVLNEAVQAAKNTLLDSELIAGKWNKEDKVCHDAGMFGVVSHNL